MHTLCIVYQISANQTLPPLTQSVLLQSRPGRLVYIQYTDTVNRRFLQILGKTHGRSFVWQALQIQEIYRVLFMDVRSDNNFEVYLPDQVIVC